MTRFQKILVPHDFSEHSDCALDAALELAGELGARIVLVHVFDRPQAMFKPYGILPAEPHITELPKAASDRLQQELDRVTTAGVEAEAQVREGHAFDEILKQIDASGADLVVMGTHGLTGLPHAVLGSVAERVVRLAPCPVMTLKADAAGG